MKRWIAALLVLVLALTLAIPALVEGTPLDIPVTMYVNKDKAKIYAEPDTGSEVLKKVKGGDLLLLEMVTEDGEWYATLVEDTKRGGQQLGWILNSDLIDTLPPKYCKHDWSSWEVVEEATCTHAGSRVRFCAICGLRDDEEIKKLKHDYTKWKISKEATCSQKGERVRTCKVCGHEVKEEYLEDHTFGSWILTKEPTCTEKGERERSCKVCGAKEKQTLDPLPHDYERQVTVEATDHSSGVRVKVCRVCGHNGGEESFDPEGTLRRKDRGEDVYTVQQLLVDQGYLNAGGADGIFGGGTEKAVIQFQLDQGLNADGIVWPQTRKRLNHEFGPWITVKEMTRAEPGERMRVCADCGFEQHEVVEPGNVLEKGRRGEDIRALQQILQQVGYDAGSFDGIYGKKLDAALAGFAAANGLVVEEGKIRPADVDALMNAWLDAAPEETWMGEGGADSPVNMALSVTLTSEADESGIATYNWSLTNLGSEKATFTALLLTFGDEPNFRQDNLVLVIDGFELKPNCGNSISGSVSVDVEWDEGNLNFAAMAVAEATGAKWLSNNVVFENADEEPAARIVAPVRSELDVNNLPDGVYPVSFDRGDVLQGASGIYMNAVHVYTQDIYDAAEVNALAVGDAIIVEGEAVPVEAIEQGDAIVVNEDLDERAFELVADEGANGYFLRGFNGLGIYTERGETTLMLDPAAVYADASEFDAEPVTAGYDGIVEAMNASANDYFVQYNTTVRIEAGKVVEINRVYVP